MSFKEYSLFLFILAISFDSYGTTIGCNSPKIIDELVSNESFKLKRTGENTHGIEFEIELANEIDDFSLISLVLFKNFEGQAEYFFHLKVTESEEKSVTDFTLSKRNIEGAELMALYQNENELCTIKVLKYRTKI